MSFVNLFRFCNKAFYQKWTLTVSQSIRMPMAARLKKIYIYTKGRARTALGPWPRGQEKKVKTKPSVDQEPRSADGRAVKKVNTPREEQEPRSAHGSAVKNKPRAEQEPRSGHGRAVNKNIYIPRVEQEPRSALAARLKKGSKNKTKARARTALGRWPRV